MSLANFIPNMWADTLLAQLRKDLVFGNLVNRDYQGTINQMGDTVRINAIGDITISNYVKDTDMSAPQALTDAQTVLTISQAKYYNFEVDDVDQAQAHPSVMAEAMSYAAYRIADTIDQYIAGFYTDAPAGSLIGTSGAPVTVTVPTQTNVGGGTTVYDELVVLCQYLTQMLIPRTGRWVVVPPWCKAHLSQDVRFTGFNTAAARADIATYGFGDGSLNMGAPNDVFLGMIESMAVYESVNAPHIGGTAGLSGSQDAIIAGHPMALTYADSVAKSEAYRPPYRFADAVKGLHLYGAKTVRPYGLAVAYLQKP